MYSQFHYYQLFKTLIVFKWEAFGLTFFYGKVDSGIKLDMAKSLMKNRAGFFFQHIITVYMTAVQNCNCMIIYKNTSKFFLSIVNVLNRHPK